MTATARLAAAAAASVLMVGAAPGTGAGPALAASSPSLGYVEAGHAMAYQLLLRKLPVAKRLPDVKCTTWVIARSSRTVLRGRFYADDCKGTGFVVLVAARKDGTAVTGWAGPTCRTSGPTKRAKGRIAPGCELGKFPF